MHTVQIIACTHAYRLLLVHACIDMFEHVCTQAYVHTRCMYTYIHMFRCMCISYFSTNQNPLIVQCSIVQIVHSVLATLKTCPAPSDQNMPLATQWTLPVSWLFSVCVHCGLCTCTCSGRGNPQTCTHIR